MDHRATRTSDRLNPSRARLVLLAVLSARLAVGAGGGATIGTAQVNRVIDGRARDLRTVA